MSVSYIAYKENEDWVLYAARVFIRNYPVTAVEFQLETQSVRAEMFSLGSSNAEIKNLIDKCLDGGFEAPLGNVKVFDDGYKPGVQFFPFHPSAIQERISLLSINSPLTRNLRFDPETKLELNAAEQPFDTFDELVSMLSLARDNDNQTSVEFVGHQSTRIIPEESRVEDGQAIVSVALALGLDPSKFSLGVRQAKSGLSTHPQDVKRFMIEGDALDWEVAEGNQKGLITFPIEESDLLQCFANYNNLNYANFWLSDPKKTSNPRRAAMSAFDPDLEQNSEHLFKDIDGKTRSNEFEAGIAWLFWMLGFSPAHLDLPNMRSLRDSPDALFCDGRSNFLIVEATVGSLKNNNKMDKLAERTTKLRETLSAQSLNHLQVVPVLVTKRNKSYVENEIEAASKLGISVVTSEDLRSFANRTSYFPDSNAVLDFLRSRLEPPDQPASK
jgi:hypothetical protein